MTGILRKVVAYFARPAKTQEPKEEERCRLRCPWCRQWHRPVDLDACVPWLDPDNGRVLVTCSTCHGSAVWDFVIAPVPLLYLTVKPPKPVASQVNPELRAPRVKN